MRILFLAPVFVIVLCGTAIAEPKGKDSRSYFIESREFVGFEQCKISDALQETIQRVTASVKPEKKEKTAWGYSTEAEVFGLPVSLIKIGVCDASGNRDCGWGNFIAVVIPKPIEEVKKKLMKQFGADFTKEKREKEYNVTLRPVLAKEKSSSETVLFCDPGSL